MSRHIEVQNLAAVMPDNEEAIENTEVHCGRGEQVHRRDSFPVVT